MQVKARAKINLALDVLGKRSDGYHEVKMVMQTIAWADEITIELKESDISLTTNLPYLPVDCGNIAYKACQLFLEESHIQTGVSIHIEKHIPVAAGLAGGSSNAAAVLKALNEMFEKPFSFDQLMAMGKRLGADVPFCMMEGTALSEGIGEKLTKLKTPPAMVLLLAKPPLSVSTAWAYGQFKDFEQMDHPNVDALYEAISSGELKKMIPFMKNVFEPIVTKQFPVINRIKNTMLGSGAIHAMMSGSGPTVFGIFPNQILAEQAMGKLKTLAKDVCLTSIC